MGAIKNKSRMYVNVVGCITMFALGMVMTSNASVFTAICVDYNMAAVGVGVFAAIYEAGVLASSVVGGEICEHIGKKKTILLSCICNIIGMLLMAYVPSLIICGAGLFLVGCGCGSLEAQSTATLADANENATRIMNISTICYSVGAVLCPLIIVAYLENGGSWHLVYTCTAGLYLCVACINMFLKLEEANTEKAMLPDAASSMPSKGIVTISLFKNFSFVIVMMLTFLYIGLESNINFWTQTMFESAHYAAFALSLFWGIMIVGRIGAGIFSTGRKRHIFFQVTLLLGLVGIVGMLLAQNDMGKLIFCSLVGIAYGPIWPCVFAMGTDMNPKNTGAASGLIMLSCGTGGTVVPLITTKLSASFGSTAVYILCIVMLLTMLTLHFVLLQREKKHQTLF